MLIQPVHHYRADISFIKVPMPTIAPKRGKCELVRPSRVLPPLIIFALAHLTINLDVYLCFIGSMCHASLYTVFGN
jgi:hypothetical protein